MIPFYDENSMLSFSVNMESLFYLEQAENYVSKCYLNKGKISKYRRMSDYIEHGLILPILFIGMKYYF